MKKNILSFLILTSSIFAHASKIQCISAGNTIALSDFNSDQDNSNSHDEDAMYERLMECADDVYFGKLCYQGRAQKAVEVLKNISSAVFESAGEYAVVDIEIQKNQLISYSMFDGSNNHVVEKHIIKKCK